MVPVAKFFPSQLNIKQCLPLDFVLPSPALRATGDTTLSCGEFLSKATTFGESSKLLGDRPHSPFVLEDGRVFRPVTNSPGLGEMETTAKILTMTTLKKMLKCRCIQKKSPRVKNSSLSKNARHQVHSKHHRSRFSKTTYQRLRIAEKWSAPMIPSFWVNAWVCVQGTTLSRLSFFRFCFWKRNTKKCSNMHYITQPNNHSKHSSALIYPQIKIKKRATCCEVPKSRQNHTKFCHKVAHQASQFFLLLLIVRIVLSPIHQHRSKPKMGFKFDWTRCGTNLNRGDKVFT